MSYKQLQFLIVDDQEIMREIITTIIEERGHRVIAAPTGHHALPMLGARGCIIDGIISDYNMPGMNGLEFLQKVWSIPGYEAIPAIIISSDTNKELINLANHYGVLAWVDKLEIREGISGLITAINSFSESNVNSSCLSISEP